MYLWSTLLIGTPVLQFKRTKKILWQKHPYTYPVRNELVIHNELVTYIIYHIAMLYKSDIVQIKVKKTSKAIIPLIECFIIKSNMFLLFYSLIYFFAFTQMPQIGQRKPQNKHYEKYNVFS